MKRILGIDLGDKRTGVAVTDLTGTLAGGLEVIIGDGLNAFAKSVMDIAGRYDISEIVIGYPVNMNGTIGESALKTEKFKGKLEKLIKEKELEITVTLFDERLSTALAYVYMNETGIKNKDKKEKVDMLSAQIILQDYIDSKKILQK